MTFPLNAVAVLPQRLFFAPIFYRDSLRQYLAIISQ
tara:strand:+ start:205102 stop:205209 length:108 start_codon:yes stop_codon:yes gene_type:complete